MTTSDKCPPTSSSHDSDGPSVAESCPQSNPSLSGDGPTTEHHRFAVRSLPEAAVALDIAADNLAAAYGMVANRRRVPAVLDALAVAEVVIDAVRHRLHILTALAEHTEPGDTAYAAALLRFLMTGQFPDEPGDPAEGGA